MIPKEITHSAFIETFKKGKILVNIQKKHTVSGISPAMSPTGLAIPAVLLSALVPATMINADTCTFPTDFTELFTACSATGTLNVLRVKTRNCDVSLFINKIKLS